MSFPQTASGLTAGLQTQYGTTTVENAAQAFWPEGFSTTAVGWSVINANPFAFDFTEVFQRPFALQFNFGGAQMVRPHGLDSFTPGLHDFETAQQAIPLGFDSATFGWPYALFDAPLTFNLVDVLQRPFALQFNFGAPQMVSGVGGQDHAVFGSALLEAPWWVQLEGWVDSGLGWTLVSRTPAWTFNLTDTGEFAPALQFNFDGPMMLAPHGWDSLQFGLSEARNLAFAAYPESIDPNGQGRPLVLRTPVLVLDLVELGDASLPMQFYFGDVNTRQFQPEGWDSLQFDHWTEVWTKPYFDVFPVGSDFSQVGEPRVSPLIIYAQGSVLSLFGNNVIWREGEIQALGLDQSEYGTAFLEIGNIIHPQGLNATWWGIPHFEYIPLVDQYIEPAGISHTAFSQDAFISNWWREVIFPFQELQDVYGTPFIDFRIRYLDVFQGIPSLETGEFQVGFHQDVEAIGRDHSLFGEPSIDIRQIYTTGWQSSTFGPDYELRVSFGQRYALMRGYRSPEIGEPRVWNRTQYVQHINLCPEPGYYCGVSWPASQFFTVLNRNRNVTPVGTVMTQFSIRAAEVNNNGRAVLVSSFDPENFGPWYEQHMISYYVRYFDFDGWDSFRMVSFHTIHNAARAIYPPGAAFTEFGTDIRHALWRWLYTWGIRQDEHGTPWVSFSPRGVQIYSNRSHAFLGKPFVDFGARYLEPEGWDSLTRWPFPVMTQKPIPTITPRWTWNEYQFGRPKIHNNTPQLFVVGRSMFSSIPQHNWVSHSPRYLEPQGFSTFSVYRPHVEFRDRTIWLWGENFLRVPQQLRVENVDPDPIVPTQQTIYAGFGCRYGSPWQGNCSGTGRPSIRTNVLRPSGFTMLSVGAPKAYNNGIRFRAQDHANLLGMTKFGVASLNRLISVHFGPFENETWGEAERGEHYGIEPSSTPPKVRVHPHTIWARLDTPQQARENHKESKMFCEVDKFCHLSTHPFGPSADGTGPWFGTINVRPEPGSESLNEIKCASNYNANSEASKLCHRMFMRVGVPKLENSKRVIPFEGEVSPRFGFPRVATPYTRTVRVWGSANVETKFGTAVVTDNGPRFALNVSLGSTFLAGSTNIENLNREVYVTGLSATQWGNNNPMVHYPRTLTPTNTDMTLWGTQWASHSPRWVFVEGFVQFESDWTTFYGRMQVRNADKHVKGYGFSIMTEWGQTTISSGVGRINPYGIENPCVSPHVTVEHV